MPGMNGSDRSGPEPTVGEQLGLGPVWQPSPVTWAFVPMQSPQGKIVVVNIATVTGVVGIAFDTDALKSFASQALEQATGLTLPKMGL